MNIKQKIILRKLVQVNGQRYSELLSNFTMEDRFPYHLKYLLTNKLISKRNDRYYLTKEGMRVTGTFDTRTLEDIKISTPLFLFICKYEDKYLVIEHFSKDSNLHRHLFALPSGYPLAGLPLEESCKKDLLRKYGVTADFKYRSTFHLITKTTDGDTLFDTIYLVFETQVGKEEVENCKQGVWLSKEEILKLENRAISVEKFLVEDNREIYTEDSVVLNYGIEENDLK